MQDSTERHMRELAALFDELKQEYNEEGDIGASRFRDVFHSLMPIQKEKLQTISGKRFDEFMTRGSLVSIAVSYRDPITSVIDKREDGMPDYVVWNEYALEYHRINQVLNEMSRTIADHFNGIALTATIGGIIGEVSHVSDYFGMVVSHRAIAEQAGLGWRGKNQLIIHEKFSCAVRFASVIIPVSLEYGTPVGSRCGSCTACEDACTFIKNREKLTDYRENCRRYILFLKSKGLVKDVCGKCIKACRENGIFSSRFSLPMMGED